MEQAPPNEIGFTRFAYWADGYGSTLEGRLEERKIPFTKAEIPHLIGMAGCAYLLFYQSPNTGLQVTVLCVPLRYDIDGFMEEYYAFEGKGRDEALQDEKWWLQAYDTCRKLMRGR